MENCDFNYVKEDQKYTMETEELIKLVDGIYKVGWMRISFVIV